MIERVAQAMHQLDRPYKAWSDASQETRLIYLDRAHIAIWVMRQPTEAMIAAAGRLNHPSDAEIWRAMSDVALVEP